MFRVIALTLRARSVLALRVRLFLKPGGAALWSSRVGKTPYPIEAIIMLPNLSHMISLSASEVERRFGLMGIPNRFTEAESTGLATTSIVDMPEGVIGFPIPQANSGLNILTLRKILGIDPSKPPSFFDHPWYLQEAFAQQDCDPGWHFLHASVVPDSISQPIHYAGRLSELGLQLPSAIEVVLMLFLNYVGTGEQLLQKKHTWCKDQASLDRFVTVGAFGRNGLFISGHPGAFASRGLGICAKVMQP
jgi:hypothetical protein